MSTPSTGAVGPSASSRTPVRAVGPRLRKLLYVVFALAALLGANSVYLASITALEWMTGAVYQDYFYQYMFLLHLLLGLILIAPFLIFGVIHMLASWNRRNRRAVSIGYALFTVCIGVLLTGLLLMRVGILELKQPLARGIVYWAHVGFPVVGVWLYWLHRLVGPRIKWKVGLTYAAAVAALSVAMVFLHSQDPRQWNAKGPKDEKYFRPSEIRTTNGKFVPARTLMMDSYCQKCHADVYQGWFHSVHHFSSFNNPAYLAAIRETREAMFKRDGNVKASRWCAGCHDPVPFLSGEFDKPDYDDVNNPTAHAGITCTVCHAITHVNSTIGNADFTIEEPMHYPFANSENPFLQWVNQTMLKAKPSFHKKTFLKDFHKTTEFCSTCHKVSLPKELTAYKDFLRGQNHHDSFFLSGVSGFGARSFNYPPKAQANCNGCHMPLQASNDFAAKPIDGSPPSIHNHLFLGANTAIAWLRGKQEIVEAHREFLEGSCRIDIFGVKEGAQPDGKLHAPLRPQLPVLEPGKTYLLETVVRTLRVGHLLTQGTADSNELWVEVKVTSGDRVIGRSGGIDAQGEVDPASHFLNIFMLDRKGNRIARRNAQDIFVPLYNHQIPPGAGAAIHYKMRLPEDLTEPVTVEVRLNYRKFDKQYMDFATSTAREGDRPIRGFEKGKPYGNPLPIVVIAEDRVTIPIKGSTADIDNPERGIPEWQRWNDYGIGLLLPGKKQLRQASEAFTEVEKLGRYDGPLNLARAYFKEGRLEEAVAAIQRANEHQDPPPPPWTIAWLSGRVNRENGHLDQAAENFRAVLEDHTEEMDKRGFDFSKDYVVRNLLGVTLFDLAKRPNNADRRDQYLRLAIDQFKKVLELDVENFTAHYNLHLLYKRVGEAGLSDEHQKLHERYKIDDNAGDFAIAAARGKPENRWADQASQEVVIYLLRRPDAPGLPPAEADPLE